MNSLAGEKIAVVGGCGHVGLPLGVKLALAGADTKLIDVDEEKVRMITSGRFPFVEKGGDTQLQEALRLGKLEATTDPSVCADAKTIVFVTGTPVDEHLNPKLSEVLRIFDSYQPYFAPGTLIVMRSTLFPGTIDHLHQRLQRSSSQVHLSFCPERVAEGFALDEIDSLPQIVAAFEEEGFKRANKIFAALAPKIIRLTPLEAEITKLMTNAWRYLEFAIANQFYMIAERNGVDFYRIYEAIRHDYPRAQGYKSPGFAAGPCLFKDTMQLASYFDHQFYLGHSAMLVNEGLASLAVEKATKLVGGSLWDKKVGLLGMTFKPDSDDIRESLSFRVKKDLQFAGAHVLCHDPYLKDSVALNEVLETSDVVILSMPHKEYRSLQIKKPLVDVWGVLRRSQVEVLPGRQKV